MKIQSIILICIIVIYQRVEGSGNSNRGKLSNIENEERLKTCGKEFLPKPSQGVDGEGFHYYNNPSWLLWATVVDNKNTKFNKSTAFPISKRHLITSSQVVLTKDKEWMVDGGEPFKETDCVNNNVHLPKHMVDSVRVVSGSNSTVKVLRGLVFWACGYGDFDKMFSPLFLEVEEMPEGTSKNIPCLADDTVPALNGTEVHSYGLELGIMKHRKLQIAGFKGVPWVHTTKYTVENDRGGPLVLNYSSEATVIGMKTSDATDSSDGVYFYSMMNLYNVICEYSGVCKTPPTTTIPTTTTTKAPTTPEPSTTTPDPSKTMNTKSSTTKSSESLTKALPTKPSGKPAQEPEKGKDSEEVTDDSSDEIEGDVEYVDEEDEVGIPLFLEPEVWNGLGRKGMELNFFVMLFLAMVFGFY